MKLRYQDTFTGPPYQVKVLVGATAVANWSVDFYIVRVSELSGQFMDVLPQISFCGLIRTYWERDRRNNDFIINIHGHGN